MYWGHKLARGMKSTIFVKRNFHISHGVLDTSNISQSVIIELHLVINSNDLVVALFSQKSMQQSFNLQFSIGEEFSMYLCVHNNEGIELNIERLSPYCVHLSGYYDHTLIAYPCNEIYQTCLVQDKAIKCSTDIQKNAKKRKRVSFGPTDSVIQYDQVVEPRLLSDTNTSTVENIPAKEAELVEDLTYGHGKLAKNGKTVFIRYVGKEASSKQVIDRIGKNERPLSFVLGRGEVMQGLDTGIKGMKVGGRRRITIPPSARKSSQTALNISKHATLILDIDLINVQ